MALALSAPALAQSEPTNVNTKYDADKSLRSNARVNPSTLAVEFSLPLPSYPGRAGIGLPNTLSYSSKVWDTFSTSFRGTGNTLYTSVQPYFARRSLSGWTSSLGVPLVDLSVAQEQYDSTGQLYNDSPEAGENYNLSFVQRIQVVMPDGSTHEMRKDDNWLSHGSVNDPSIPDDILFNGTYLSVDGSRMRLDLSRSGTGVITGVLSLPDGSRFLNLPGIGTGNPVYIDRHGNRMTYNLAANQWTDTLGRVLDNPLPALPTAPSEVTITPPAEGTYTFNYPGLNNNSNHPQQVQVVWQKLSVQQPALAHYTDKYCAGAWIAPFNPPSQLHLFTSHNESYFRTFVCRGLHDEFFNPTLLTAVRLPNGARYAFRYNVYGEIERIDYPTGGYERFVYQQVPPISSTNKAAFDQINRGVWKRFVSPDGTAASEIEWKYEIQRETTSTQSGPYHVKTFAPDLTWSEQLLKDQWSRRSSTRFGYSDITTGRAFEERAYSAAANPANSVLLRRRLIEWMGTPPVGTGAFNPARDLRPGKEISITFELGSTAALATMSETVYDENADAQYFAALNPKRVKTYKYKVLDLSTAQTASLATIAAQFTQSDVQSISETDYLYDANYKARNIVGLATEQRVMNPASPANFVAKSQISYDEVAYPILTYGTTVTGWEDPGITAKRALATTTKTWDSSANAGAGNWIVSHAQYDQFGNLRKSWQPKYEGSGAPDRITETQYSSMYNYAYPTLVTTPAPGNGTNGSASGFATAMSYDFNTGLPLTSTDANVLETRIEYADALLRPTKVSTYFLGQQVGGTSETFYGAPDSAGQLPATERFVKTRSSIDASSWTESLSWFDGLGRTTKTQKKDASSDVFGFVCYDQMSRPYKSSNPFRGAEPSNPCGSTQADLHWTTSIFDDLGRPTEIRSPLESGQTVSAKVLTNYSLATAGSQIGTVVTVKDQAGKERRSITNALGQLIRVDEPTAAGLGTLSTPNQPTNYVYDALSNLATVTQAGQTRTFAYDSLSRLKSAQNPESGQINYSYDANGNLVTKIDARNITTTFAYDALNRVTGRSYSDGMTPAVSYYYDGTGLGAVPANSKGKLTRVASSVSETRYTAFDELGRTKASQQMTDGVTYNFSDYSYNLAGALISQKYPSGRQVRNVFDADGDLAGVSSRSKQTNPLKPYASNFSYTPHGAIAAMQLGNNRWETTLFNNRLQPIQLGLGTTSTVQDLWKASFEYGTATTNNGNVTKQTIVVPNTTTGGTTYNGFTATQNYAYDSLNRLQSAEEKIGTPQTWKQTFVYDRFGNRGFDLANTTTPTTANGLPKVINPEVDPSTNRLQQTQYTEANVYLYDAAGNLTKDALGKQYSYDAENKQREVKDSGNNSLGKYVYDGDGRRVKKVTASETTIFVYDAAGKLAAEYSTTPPPPPAQATTSYLTTDHLGSPRVITDQTGKVTSRRDFLPFGEDLSTPQRTPQLGYAADNVRQRFTGYEKDQESGLEYAQARYYNNQYGRFTSVDPLLSSAHIISPQSWNRYTYTTNNPLNLTDPTGMYIYVPGTSSDDQKRIDGAYKNLLKARDSYKQGTKEYDAINRSITRLGKPGEDNGVLIAVGATDRGTPGSTYSALDYSDDNKVTGATSAITLDLSQFKKGEKGDMQLTDALGHEGSHAADAAEVATKYMGQADTVVEQAAKNGLLTSKAISEVGAYRVSSYIAASYSNTGSYTVGAGKNEIWSKGWKAAEADKKRDAGIKGILQDSNGSYKYSFKQSGSDSSLDNPSNWAVNGGPAVTIRTNTQ